jgi:roundabout axon guidance receptor 2
VQPSVTNPRIIEHPETQYVAKNEPATLNCKAEGDPAPVITWYRNNEPVITANENPSSHRMLLPSGQLFFLRIIHNKNNKPDVGVYHCVATNPVNKVSVQSTNATLEIAGKWTKSLDLIDLICFMYTGFEIKQNLFGVRELELEISKHIN